MWERWSCTIFCKAHKSGCWHEVSVETCCHVSMLAKSIVATLEQSGHLQVTCNHRGDHFLALFKMSAEAYIAGSLAYGEVTCQMLQTRWTGSRWTFTTYPTTDSLIITGQAFLDAQTVALHNCCLTKLHILLSEYQPLVERALSQLNMDLDSDQ